MLLLAMHYTPIQSINITQQHQSRTYYDNFSLFAIYYIQTDPNLNYHMLKRLNRNVDYTSKQILRFFWASQMVFLLPMIIASLSLINSVSSPCLAINFNGDDKVYFGIFFLGQWVSTDAYIKLAILVALLFIVRLSDQLNCDKTLVVIAGVLLRFYYIFAFGWTIAVSVLFWGYNSNLPRPTYVYCEGSPYQGYLFFLLIYTYIIIPINLVICGFRSGKQATSEMPSISTDRSRGQTELMQKNVQVLP